MKNVNSENELVEKLKDNLKELFQFDSSDLDFGIYRIMNYKRKEIEDFIEQDLIKTVDKEFEKYKTQNSKELTEKIQENENNHYLANTSRWSLVDEKALYNTLKKKIANAGVDVFEKELIDL